jgi:hypothetical protein
MTTIISPRALYITLKHTQRYQDVPGNPTGKKTRLIGDFIKKEIDYKRVRYTHI